MPHARVNGARLWYEVRGHGQPILLHHGYTASRVNWAPVAERLLDRYRIILMECRGTGESEHTEAGYTLEQFAADVIGLLDTLHIDRVTFAGHSMGGGIGYRLALDHAARLERLILMAPIPADGIGPIDPAMRAARLGEIGMPVLMIAGAVDGLLPANLQDFLRLPNATLEVLSRAGHEVAVHEPDRVAAAIAAFMEHGAVAKR